MISRCPSCQRALQVPDEMIGKKVRCTGCQAVFAVEASIPAAPPPPVEAKPDPPAPASGSPFDFHGDAADEPLPGDDASTPILNTGESYLANLARRSARTASIWMLTAIGLAALRLVLDIVCTFLALGLPREMQSWIRLPACGYGLLFAPQIILMVFGFLALRKAGSRLVIGLAALCCFTIALYSCYGTFPAYIIGAALEDGENRQTEKVRILIFAILLVIAAFHIVHAVIGFCAGITTLSALSQLKQANLHGPPPPTTTPGL